MTGLSQLNAAQRVILAGARDLSYQQTRSGSVVAFQYLPWKRLRVAPKTLDVYERDLARGCLLRPELAPKDWTAGDLLEVFATYPQPSVRRAMAAYRDFFKFAVIYDHVEPGRNPMDKIQSPKAESTRIYDIFDDKEMLEIAHAQRDSTLPKRDLLGILIFQDLGVRKNEARHLQLRDFDPGTRTVKILRAKGGKQRVVPYSEDIHTALIDFTYSDIPRVRTQDNRGWYLVDRPPESTDYVFFPNGKPIPNSRTPLWTEPWHHMSEGALHRWWVRAIGRSDVEYRKLHMNRHSVGTHLVDEGVDLFAVKDWLGHANLNTTETYVHNSRARLVSARDKLSSRRRRAEDEG